MEKDRTAAFFLVVVGRIDGDKEGYRAGVDFIQVC